MVGHHVKIVYISVFFRRFRICNRIIGLPYLKIGLCGIRDLLRPIVSPKNGTFYVTDVTDVRGRRCPYHFVRAVFCAESDGVKENGFSTL